MGIFDWKHWIVLLVVVVLVFGTKKLKNFGSDLGESIKGFRKAMNEEEAKPAEQAPPPAQPVPPVQNTAQQAQGHTIEGQAQPVQEPQRKD
ncbi:sec-independent protein translocase protein TatA [Pseudomonas sp. TE6288]|jgi:sec-independent protein translocase protein TatA|uniref:Sec-independent protein translocase protein TatA n=1 Tax=Pseudomonas soli TaxID=1306993 RepID=A0A2V4HV73_9PSED|nr:MULTISPECIES: twin-arginine translocase TatA/TatE family subunit [Pseudomonas]MBI6954132.1 twin-arginine translocase TatA/TatE family subunit [Pseudomonas sp. CCOS 191]MDF9753830.1 sec-independent protein translocase protein TatA [Pseudomonas hunanensis]PNA01747.1 twin-arginine translocase TatA/TatE family subunit [Pseudomonas sp. FW305-42]PNA25698.1 twin-arginine translocase TatA/TatE family subunit [Pseudomonas sp. MPR-R1B]PNB27221.1 twin-arginine translocase TatA/TatE family subunit [Pse